MTEQLREYITLRNRLVQMKVDGYQDTKDFQWLLEEMGAAFDKLIASDINELTKYELERREPEKPTPMK